MSTAHPPPSDERPSDASRRTFCAGICRAASAVAATVWVTSRGAAASDPAASKLLPRVRGDVSEGAIRVPTTSNALSAVGGRVRVVSTAGSFLVARTGDATFVALSATCSHESCLITDIEDDSYVCPCHGSQFDVGGAVLTGPAESALYKVTATFADDQVTISLR